MINPKAEQSNKNQGQIQGTQWGEPIDKKAPQRLVSGWLLR
jgi:hypothetical protein